MKVLVAVSEATAVDDTFELDGTRIADRHLMTEFNEWDEYALEAAVRLKEDGLVDEVVTATIGPATCEDTIYEAIAKGADRAIRVWDEALADLDLLDVGTKTTLLAAVAETEDPALFLTGVQSPDTGFMATGVSIADEIGLAWASVVKELDLDPDDGLVRVECELEGGLTAVTEVELPAVLTIQTGINQPRYASLRGIRSARQQPLEHRTLADLGLDADAISADVTLDRMDMPESESTATVFEGPVEETASDLATVLRELGAGR